MYQTIKLSSSDKSSNRWSEPCENYLKLYELLRTLFSRVFVNQKAFLVLISNKSIVNEK